MTPTFADSILTGFRSTSTRGPEVAGEPGEGMSLVCIYNTRINPFIDFLCFGKPRM